MKRLMAAALLVALASAPSIAQAATTNAAPLAPTAVVAGRGESPVISTPVGATPATRPTTPREKRRLPISASSRAGAW